MADGLAAAHVVERRRDPRRAGTPSELGPGDPVERELERIGGLLAVGLPVDDQPAAVRLGVHRVDAAAHHLAGQHERERRLDGVRAPGRRTDPDSKRAISSRRSSSSSMPRSPRPGRSSGSSSDCWPNRASTQAWKRVPKRAAGEGCRGIGRASSRGEPVGVVAQPRHGRRRQARRAAGTSTTSERSARASVSSRSSSASQSSTRAVSTMSSPSSPRRRASAARTSSAAATAQLGPRGRAPGDGPRRRRVASRVGVGGALLRLVQPLDVELEPAARAGRATRRWYCDGPNGVARGLHW